MAKPGRNDPCPCGSGQKYKRCCLPKDEQAESDTLKAAAEARAAAVGSMSTIMLTAITSATSAEGSSRITAMS